MLSNLYIGALPQVDRAAKRTPAVSYTLYIYYRDSTTPTREGSILEALYRLREYRPRLL